MKVLVVEKEVWLFDDLSICYLATDCCLTLIFVCFQLGEIKVIFTANNTGNNAREVHFFHRKMNVK